MGMSPPQEQTDRVSSIIPKLYLRPSAGVFGRLTWSGQANLFQHSTLLRQVAHSTKAMQAGCCFKGSPKRVALRSLFPCAQLRHTPRTIEDGSLSRWSIDQREWLDGLRIPEYYERGWVIEQLQMVQAA